MKEKWESVVGLGPVDWTLECDCLIREAQNTELIIESIKDVHDRSTRSSQHVPNHQKNEYNRYFVPPCVSDSV